MERLRPKLLKEVSQESPCIDASSTRSGLKPGKRENMCEGGVMLLLNDESSYYQDRDQGYVYG